MRLLLVIAIMLLSACVPFGKLGKSAAVAPSVEVAQNGAVAVAGDAKTPAKVDTKKTGSVLSIPEGSKFEFNEKLGTLSLVISKATQMSVERQETAIQGPVAFDPPAQPTAKELADAQSDFWVNLGLKAGIVVGLALAGFGLVRGWDLVMYGGAAIGAACAFGVFVEKHPILLSVIGLGVAAATIGPILWHSKLKHIDK